MQTRAPLLTRSADASPQSNSARVSGAAPQRSSERSQLPAMQSQRNPIAEASRPANGATSPLQGYHFGKIAVSGRPQPPAKGAQRQGDAETPKRAAMQEDGAGTVDSRVSTSTPLPAAVSRQAEQRLGVGLGEVRIHDHSYADRLARQRNAEAFTVENNIFFRANRYAPHNPGDRLLHHELAHVAQYRRGLLHHPVSQLEAQADNAAAGRTNFRSIPYQRPSAPARVLRQATKAICSGIDLKLPHSMVFHGSAGDFTLYAAVSAEIPPGSYSVTYDEASHQLFIPSLAGGRLFSVSGTIKGTPAQIKAGQDNYQSYVEGLAKKPVTLTVTGVDDGSGLEAGAGKGGGKGGDAKGKDAGAPKAQAAPGGKGATPGGAGAKPGGAGTGAGAGKGKGVPQQGSGGTTVKITDPKQLDELKRRGLLDDATAADIKERSEKKQPIPFEELMALYKALSETMVLRAASKDAAAADKQQDDWMDVARFIQANRDKFSGQQSTGDSGMSLDDMKQILAKYHEFVGVRKPAGADKPGAPPTPTKLDHFDPQKRKEWNSLQPWEQDVWKRYTAKYGEPTNDGSAPNLHLDAAAKFSMAFHMSPDYMRAGGQEAFRALINDPLFIGGTIVGITLYVAAWLAPEPIFSKATAATITLALLTIFTVMEIKNFAFAWMALSDESEAANSFEEIEAAAEHFGKAMGGILLRVMVTIAMMLMGKVLPGPKPLEGNSGGGPGATGSPEPIGNGGGTGGGLRPATVTGPSGTATAAPAVDITIQVLADGTVVMAAPRAGVAAHSMMVQNGGGGSSGGSGKGSGSGSGKGSGKSASEKGPRRSSFSDSDIHDSYKSETDGHSQSPSDPDALNREPSKELEDENAEQGAAKLTPRETWKPPAGAKPKPPAGAPRNVRLGWLRERLQMHVDGAIERYRSEGLTPAQEQALHTNRGLAEAFRGSRIDSFAKDSIMQDPDLADVVTAPDFFNEPDVLDSVYPDWFDITTRRQWNAHIKTYGARYMANRGSHLSTDPK